MEQKDKEILGNLSPEEILEYASGYSGSKYNDIPLVYVSGDGKLVFMYRGCKKIVSAEEAMELLKEAWWEAQERDSLTRP